MDQTSLAYSKIMISKKYLPHVLFLLFVLATLSACGTLQAPPSTPTPETIAVATATLPPTATATAEPSPTPSKTPSPTATATLTTTPTPPPVASEFSNLIIALDYDHDAAAPLSPRDFFPVGVSYIAAVFDYNVPGWTELDWTIKDDKQKTQASGVAGLNIGEGKKPFIIYPEEGLDEGNYELVFKLEDEIVLSRPFSVFWAPTLWPVSIGAISSQTGEIEEVHGDIPFGADYLLAAYPTINFAVGDEISATWYVDGKQLGTYQYVWDSSEWSSGNHTNKIDNQIGSGAPLPTGNYELFVSVNDTPTQCKTFMIYNEATPAAEVEASEPSDRCQAVQDNANPAASADTWRRYQPRTFAEVEAFTNKLLTDITEENVIYIESSPEYQYPSRILVKYTGEFRKTSPLKLEGIKAWAYNNMPSLSSEEAAAMFSQEALFTEGNTEYWLPVQSELIPVLEEALSPGVKTEVLVVWMGALVDLGEVEDIYLVNAFWE